MAEKTLKYLFDIVLRYQEGKEPVSKQGKVGEYTGSGEGTVSGPKINGRVHWTLFEDQSPTVCQSNLFGVITTDDGAWGCPKSRAALFDFPLDALFYGYLWALTIKMMPLSGIVSHFRLSKKENSLFLDNPSIVIQGVQLSV